MIPGRLLALALLGAAPSGGFAATPVQGAAPPIPASWSVDEPDEPLAQPKHFTLPPDPGGAAALITASRLFPTVLVVTEQPVVRADGITILPASTQLFQQGRGDASAFCPLVSVPKFGNFCLLDTDRDGTLDSVGDVKIVLPVPRLLLPGPPKAKLLAGVTYRQVDRRQCTCNVKMYLSYLGSRQMLGKPRATFMTHISDPAIKGQFYHGDYVQLDMEQLPASTTVLGAGFANVHAEGKNLVFDLTGGFTTGPFEVRTTPLRDPRS